MDEISSAIQKCRILDKVIILQLREIFLEGNFRMIYLCIIHII